MPDLKVLLSRETIAKRVAELGEEITRDFQGQSIIFVGVLKGAAIFLSDLARQVPLDATFDFIGVSSYGNRPTAKDDPAGHAAWDSEFYISIALHGYEDPAMRAASPDSTPDVEVAGPKKGHPTWVSLNHAFFPGYPFAMGLIARPLAANSATSFLAESVVHTFPALSTAMPDGLFRDDMPVPSMVAW